MQKDFVIVGGGVAGLAAACRLAELGEKPLIIEGGKFPSHKICGEFFSPESVKWLKKWGITFEQSIDRILFDMGDSSWNLSLPEPAGSMSHLVFDQKLFDVAKSLGASMLTETKVLNISTETRGFCLHLSSGEQLQTEHLLIAAGRLPFLQNLSVSPTQSGRKAYFSELKVKAPLTMFSFPGTYVGVSAVEKDIYNVALLTRQKEIPSLEQLKSLNPQMAKVFTGAHQLFPWMDAKVPPFGFKHHTGLENAFFIGDAAATIPPASGAGLSLALASGIMAADFATQSNAVEFKRAWEKAHRRQLRIAALLHHTFQRPLLLKAVSRLFPFFPSLPRIVFSLTREKLFS